jgi:ABC-type spermidine/putrescine transport system permease subunit I
MTPSSEPGCSASAVPTQQPNHDLRPKRVRHGRAIAALAPFTILVSALVVFPLCFVALVSFYRPSTAALWEPALTITNYERLLLDPHYLRLIWDTIRIGIETTLCCCVLGYILAYFLARSRSRYIALYVLLLVAPMMVSTVIRTFGWIIVLGQNGVLNNLLMKLPLFTEPVGFMYTEFAVVLGLTSLLLPYMVLPLMSAIESIPRALEEAASNLGASKLQTFLKIVLPLSIPGLISGSMLVYLVAISALVVPALMGAPKVRMLGNQIYDSVLVSFNWPFASATSMIIILLTFAVLVVYLGTLRRHATAGRDA